MVDATAYVAWLDGHGGGNVSSYYMSGALRPRAPRRCPRRLRTDAPFASATDRRGDHVLPTGEALADVAVVRLADTGALSFRFTRQLRGSAGTRGVNASSPLDAGPTPLCWGLFPAWTVRGPGDHPVHDDMHVRWSHRPTVVNLANGESERGAGGMGTALTAHGTRVRQKRVHS